MPPVRKRASTRSRIESRRSAVRAPHRIRRQRARPRPVSLDPGCALKRARGLFERLADRDWFEATVDDALRGKRRRPAVAHLLVRRESAVRELAGALADGRWHPAPMRPLTIRDPKPRVIAWSPLEDRLVFHALARLIEQVFLPSASETSYACIPGRGVHRARLRLMRHLRRAHWFVHLDLRSYFPSICTDRLRALLARRIADRPFLEVLDRVLRAGAGFADRPRLRRFARMEPDWPPRGRGLPIGAATSQTLAAHVYLQRFDHWVQRERRPTGYLRYVDDLFLFERDRERLEELRRAIAAWLDEHRSARLKSPNARVRSCRGALDALGARITREGVAPLPRRARELRAALRREVWRPIWPSAEVDLRLSLDSRLGEVLWP